MSLNLSLPGTRIYLHASEKVHIDAVLDSLVLDIRKIASSREIVIITSDSLSKSLPVTHFRIFQISQQFIETLLLSDPIFIIEPLSNFGQFTLPRDKGRVIAIGTDLTSLKALMETSRFMSQQTVTKLSPWDLALYLKAIGQVISPIGSFVYTGHPVQIPMTVLQYQEYLNRLSSDRQPKKYSTLQVTNFLYPQALQSMHNMPRDQRPQIVPDVLIHEGGWVANTITNELAQRSPKLYWLASYLKQNPGKHIIHTSFNESNGTKIISVILRMLGHDVVSITGNDRQKDRLLKLDSFRELLVTNLYPFTDMSNSGVRSLILFEQSADDNLFNAYLKRMPNGIAIIFLISTGPNGEPTLEISNYLELVSSVQTRNTIVQLLKQGPIDLETVQKGLNVPQLTAIELRRNFPGPLMNYTSTLTS